MSRRLVAARLHSSALSALLLATVSGCASGQPRQSDDAEITSPNRTIRDLYAFYDDTAEATGQHGWSQAPPHADEHDLVPDKCDLPDGAGNGVRYSDWLGGPGSDDATTAANRVADYWVSRGVAVEVVVPDNPDDPLIRVIGDSPAIQPMYWVEPGASSINIVMPCIPGDYIALTDGVIEHRASQSPPAGP